LHALGDHFLHPIVGEEVYVRLGSVLKNDQILIVNFGISEQGEHEAGKRGVTATHKSEQGTKHTAPYLPALDSSFPDSFDLTLSLAVTALALALESPLFTLSMFSQTGAAF